MIVQILQWCNSYGQFFLASPPERGREHSASLGPLHDQRLLSGLHAQWLACFAYQSWPSPAASRSGVKADDLTLPPIYLKSVHCLLGIPSPAYPSPSKGLQSPDGHAREENWRKTVKRVGLQSVLLTPQLCVLICVLLASPASNICASCPRPWWSNIYNAVALCCRAITIVVPNLCSSLVI